MATNTRDTGYTFLSSRDRGLGSGGSRGGGATGARPPKIGSAVIFYNPFCIRMLKNGAQIAL